MGRRGRRAKQLRRWDAKAERVLSMTDEELIAHMGGAVLADEAAEEIRRLLADVMADWEIKRMVRASAEYDVGTRRRVKTCQTS